METKKYPEKTGVDNFDAAIYTWSYFWDNPHNSNVDTGFARVEATLTREFGIPPDVAPLIAEVALNAYGAEHPFLGLVVGLRRQ
jgi:hypothetical protein